VRRQVRLPDNDGMIRDITISAKGTGDDQYYELPARVLSLAVIGGDAQAGHLPARQRRARTRASRHRRGPGAVAAAGPNRRPRSPSSPSGYAGFDRLQQDGPTWLQARGHRRSEAAPVQAIAEKEDQTEGGAISSRHGHPR
jgi:hypothetical protein